MSLRLLSPTHAPLGRPLKRAFAWSRTICVFREVPPVRERVRQIRESRQTIGLVPTMGALHQGHLSLIRAAAKENDKVFVSIYVNPTQFGVHEDLDNYPKTWDKDMALLKDLNSDLEAEKGGIVEAVFAPTTKVMYPTLPPDSTLPGVGSFVTITPLANILEGKTRPVFFRGVATVCMKLFNIVQPERVYFGQKDAQQTLVIKQMVKDLHVNTEVRITPTERERDGLAMSSRNVYLGHRRRQAGLVLSLALRAAESAYFEGKATRDEILAGSWDVINRMQMSQDTMKPEERARFEIDYISLGDPNSMEELSTVDPRRGAILSGAVKMLPLEETKPGELLGLGDDQIPVRLIDNIPLPPIDESRWDS